MKARSQDKNKDEGETECERPPLSDGGSGKALGPYTHSGVYPFPVPLAPFASGLTEEPRARISVTPFFTPSSTGVTLSRTSTPICDTFSWRGSSLAVTIACRSAIVAEREVERSVYVCWMCGGICDWNWPAVEEIWEEADD